jgi:hypothetical protein
LGAQFYSNSLADHRGIVIGGAASCSESPWFKSRSKGLLYQIFCGLPRFLQTEGHIGFLPRAFQFITFKSSYHSAVQKAGVITEEQGNPERGTRRRLMKYAQWGASQLLIFTKCWVIKSRMKWVNMQHECDR